MLTRMLPCRSSQRGCSVDIAGFTQLAECKYESVICLLYACSRHAVRPYTTCMLRLQLSLLIRYWCTAAAIVNIIVILITKLFTAGSNQQGPVRTGLSSARDGPLMMKSYQLSHDGDAVVYNPDMVSPCHLSHCPAVHSNSRGCLPACLPARQIDFSLCVWYSHLLQAIPPVASAKITPVIAVISIPMTTLMIRL